MKAPHLRPGDTIGVVSPSFGAAGLFPHRLERGINYLKLLGFNVKIGRQARNNLGYVSDTPENRVSDIHQMFADPEVSAILAAIGGDHSCHLLPWLDFELIRENPKIFMGYSDITVLNLAIWSATGLVTFNGPALISEFAEYPEMFAYTRDSALKVLCEPQPAGRIEPSSWWTEDFLNWKQKEDLERPRQRLPSAGWSWLKGGSSQGKLVGGCLESLEHLRGTPYWPDWQEALFFFETSEEKPEPARVDSLLMDYQNMGVFDQITGMLVGRPMYYSEGEKQQLREIILERTRPYHFPIVADMDFGHTDPKLTLPIGCQALLESETQHFEILEPAVS